MVGVGRYGRSYGSAALRWLSSSCSSPKLAPQREYSPLSRSVGAEHTCRILYRRAARLRRLTGNPSLKSEGEIESEEMTLAEVARMTLVRPFVLSFTEPIVAAWNLYIMLVYGILYIFIESFQVVFVEEHGFNLGENGLAFMVRPHCDQERRD